MKKKPHAKGRKRAATAKQSNIGQKEIAAQLGIDQSTVSYILAGKRLERFGAETIRNVQKLADSLGYRPSRTARLLRGAGSRMVGVLEFDTRSAVMRRCLEAVCADIIEKGYTPLALDANWFAQTPGSVYETLLDQQVEGVVLIGFGDHFAKEDLRRLLAANLPVVVCMGLKVPGVFQVDIDRHAAFAELTRATLAAGARHPCFLGRSVTKLRNVTRPPWEEAANGFAEAAGTRQRTRIEIVRDFTGWPTDFAGSGRAGMARILSRRPPADAVLCYNDFMAIGAIAACADAGMKVPGDIAIHGFGDEDISQHLRPALSTVKLREKSLALMAVDTLFDSIQSGKPPPDRQAFLTDAWDICGRQGHGCFPPGNFGGTRRTRGSA